MVGLCLGAFVLADAGLLAGRPATTHWHWAEAFARRGLRRRDWAVELEESAIELLIDRGFSTTLGARPLKRALEQLLLAPLAAAIVDRRCAR